MAGNIGSNAIRGVAWSVGIAFGALGRSQTRPMDDKGRIAGVTWRSDRGLDDLTHQLWS